MKLRFKQFFSVDSPKAIKAKKYRYLNAINYMSPHQAGGVGNLCSHASPGCINLCLGLYSGQASIVSAATNHTNSTRDSRKRKAQYFMRERHAYMSEMLIHIARLCRLACTKRLKLCVRPNGSTDIAYEGIRVMVTPELAARLSKISGHKVTAGLHTIFSAFPRVQFVDYTKNHHRFKRALPANYDLTFSLSELNLEHALSVLAKNVNVAVVSSWPQPVRWHGFKTINGDEHDLRHLDPKGVAVWLSPKGSKAKRDASGFVLRHLD